MAAIRATATIFGREIFRSSTSLTFIRKNALRIPTPFRFISCSISYTPVRCAAGTDSAGGGGRNKSSARMSQVQQLLHDAKERSAGRDEPIPKITLDHVSVSFARSGGPGGQNVNKVNTKVDMRFNIKEAYWLSERVKEKILQMEKNRINKDGELVISSTKTRTQKLNSVYCTFTLYGSILFINQKVTCLKKGFFFRGNIQDALEKLQEIIDAACYVPPPPSEEQVKKITKLAAISESRRLQGKKVLSQKKAFRRSRDSYD